MISPSAAEEVTKVHCRSDILMEGVSGTVHDVYTAKKVIQFGHLRQQNQEISGPDTAPQSDSAGIELAGSLGFQTLGMLDVTIDYRDGLLNFSYDPKKWNAVKHRYRHRVSIWFRATVESRFHSLSFLSLFCGLAYRATLQVMDEFFPERPALLFDFVLPSRSKHFLLDFWIADSHRYNPEVVWIGRTK